MLSQTRRDVAPPFAINRAKPTGSIWQVPNLAGATGLEPATFGVTGRLNY
jgi:hypothetical protein